MESFYEASLAGARENSMVESFVVVEAPKPAPVEEKKAPAAVAKAPVKKAAPVAKTPTREKKGKIWELCYYKEETIKFEGKDVDNGVMFKFFNCEKCHIVIIGKFKGFLFSRCKRINFQLEDCISLGEMLNCDDMKVTPFKALPCLSVEKSNGVQVFATDESKEKIEIRTTASQSVSFCVPKEEGTYDPEASDCEDSITTMIPETYITKLVDKQVKIVALDLAD